MNTCDICDFHGPLLGKDNGFAECLNPKVKAEGSPELDGLSEADTNGYTPCIYTGNKFGCIHHTSKRTARLKLPEQVPDWVYRGGGGGDGTMMPIVFVLVLLWWYYGA